MRNIKKNVIMFFATGSYIGKIPFASGTFGTLVGIPIFFYLAKTQLLFSIIFILIFSIFSIWIAGRAEKIIGKKDSGLIVIDEIAGYLVTTVGLPFDYLPVILGFFLFRFFDILKPFPAGYFDKRLHGGTGIVLDDLMAGIYAAISVRLILYFI